MKRLIWLLGISGLGVVALLVAFRGQAMAASDPAICLPADGFVTSICINVPTSSVHRDTTVPLVSLPSQHADVRVEITVGPDAIALAFGVDRSVERIETLFGRTFSARPRVIVFGSALSFSTGARELFGYSAETADRVASTYGGIFDRATATIAVNWSASGSQRMSAAIAHELTHLMIREATGGSDIPAWLDEGIATLVEQDAAGTSIATADEQLSGRAVAATGAITLAQLVTIADFHAAYARLDRPLYAYAAYATRVMGERMGWEGILAVLAAAKAGDSFEAAYTMAANEPTSALDRRIAADTSAAIITTGVDARGDARWSLFAGTPGTEVQVSITGATGYSVTFVVMTDSLGMYRGSFGSTAAAGAFTVHAAGTSATFSTSR